MGVWLGVHTLGLNHPTGEGGVGRLGCRRVGPEADHEDPMGQLVCLGIGGAVEALIGFKLKNDVTGIPVWYGHLMLSLGYGGKVVLGRTKLEVKELGKHLPEKDHERSS